MAKNKKFVRKGLGKGLDALLSSNAPESLERSDVEETFEIAVDKIDKSPFQPRSNFSQEALQELAESIRLQGLIQPITIREKQGDRYELISGERRLQASQIAGLKKISAYILKVEDQQAMEMALIENIQREDLSAIEVAESYQKVMVVLGLSQEELAHRVSKDRATISNYLRLLQLPEEIRKALLQKRLSMGHARALLGASSHAVQMEVFNKTLQNKLSVREVERLIKDVKKDENPKPAATSSYDKERNTLEKRFGSKVNLKLNEKGKGKIKIPYESEEELLDIIKKLKKD